MLPKSFGQVDRNGLFVSAWRECELAGGRLQTVQVLDGPAGEGGGGEDGSFVVFQDSERLGDVVGVVFAEFGRDGEVGAEERGAEFGDEFFGGVAGVGEAFAAEFAVEEGRVAGPVGDLVGRSVRPWPPTPPRRLRPAWRGEKNPGASRA